MASMARSSQMMTPVNLDEITKSEGDIEPTNQSNKSKSNPPKVIVSVPSKRTSAKRTPSPARTKPPRTEQEEEADRLAQTILSQSTSSSGDVEKLHLSSGDESKSYQHHLLKAEEQEYANSIIEKYLEQLSVTPQ